jgi:predicted unusual protein kinase regulating ubiquinone biosynthesis (AarF/ABC1/UbiB family)
MLRSRYRRIVLFFARATLSLILWEVAFPLLGLGARVRRTRPSRLRRLATRFRALAVRMGGVLIKVGQFLSARLDLLPEEITSELAGLQDEVPPEDFSELRRLAEKELGAPLDERFEAFDEQPLAAASLGQAHRARLKVSEDGSSGADASLPEDVVVKIQRPGIEKLIATDLAALATVGRWLERYPPIRRRADIPALLAEFTRVLHQEIDYLAEGKNAEAFAASFARTPGVRVPRVVWSHTTRRVLTLENVYGIKVTDHAALGAAGVPPSEVAARLFDTYLTQIFQNAFFHGDPHPGNLFVSLVPGTPQGAGRWQLTFVDFGMVGRLTPTTRAGLREAVIALGMKDAHRLVKAGKLLDIFLPGADLGLVERALATALERFWGRSMGEMWQGGAREVGELIGEFRSLLYAMPFQIPQDQILLGRTLGILSGISTGLDPSFNAWTHIAPFAQGLLSEDRGQPWKGWLAGLGSVVRALVDVPQRADDALGRLERGEVAVRMPDLTEHVSRLELTLRRLLGGLLFAAFLAGGLLVDPRAEGSLARVLLGGAALSLAWVVLARQHKG